MTISDDTKAILEFLAERFNPGIQAQMRMSKEEMQAIRFPEAPPATVPTRVKCVHPNGYRFTAVLAPSSVFPGGRWVGIEDEQWPTDEELCASISWWERRTRWVDASDRSKGYNADTKLWLYDEIRLPILRAVGGTLPIDWREDMQEQVKRIRHLAAAERARVESELAKLPAPPPEPAEKPEKTARAQR